MTDADSTPPVPDAILARAPTPRGSRSDDGHSSDDRHGGVGLFDASALNRTHDKAGLRSRGGIVVRSIEDRRRELVVARVRRALSLLASGSPLRSGVVADVGCEDGWIARGYAEQAAQTILVDVDPRMLARACESSIPRCRTVVADAAFEGAVAPSSVDVVVLSAILEHVRDPKAVLAAWAPALSDGGRFVVYVPADRPILALKRVLRATRLGFLVRGVSLDPAPGHVRTFSRRSLVRLLKPFGVLEELEFDPAVLGYAATVRVARRAGQRVATTEENASAEGKR